MAVVWQWCCLMAGASRLAAAASEPSGPGMAIPDPGHCSWLSWAMMRCVPSGGGSAFGDADPLAFRLAVRRAHGRAPAVICAVSAHRLGTGRCLRPAESRRLTAVTSAARSAPAAGRCPAMMEADGCFSGVANRERRAGGLFPASANRMLRLLVCCSCWYLSGAT